ncbi:uncharacterized protein LOC108741657 [Agrilus planipennis]|uniref:Uncharacterized protein LOC108741657 n=1 Tax=Agrilus planipennis TaxID=224129 RepID=A0A7F5R0I9_AGRPL|nr:uncharacterized protein LOC108741657 [Agrilus planipennis]
MKQFAAKMKLFVLCFVILLQFIQKSHCISCYQCSGTDNKTPFECNEFLDSDTALVSTPCDDVYDAKYCIKHVGRFEAKCIDCYQCSSTNTLDCTDLLINSGGIQTNNCTNVYGAEYCVKAITLEGGVGTKRFCSSLDLGNYCNYVKQPGDTLTYRTCVYTCTGDGCNPATTFKLSQTLLFLLLAFSFVCNFVFRQ